MVGSERTSEEWFTEAARCYREHHQGCAWCGASERVFRREHGNCVEYYCSGCDFRAAHDADTGRYYSIPGVDKRDKSPETMFEL